MYEEEPTTVEEAPGEIQVEEEVEEVELLELTPLELEFFLTRSDIWDRLVRGEIGVEEAKKMLDNLYSSTVLQPRAPIPMKGGRRRASKRGRKK